MLYKGGVEIFAEAVVYFESGKMTSAFRQVDLLLISHKASFSRISRPEVGSRTVFVSAEIHVPWAFLSEGVVIVVYVESDKVTSVPYSVK